MTSYLTPWTRFRFADCQTLVDIGSSAVIDFGLAGLFERFEREFGRSTTRAILALVGLTIVVVCVGLVFQFAWALYLWTQTTFEGTSTVWLVAKLIGAITSIGALIIALVLLGHIVEGKYLINRVQPLVDKSAEVHESCTGLYGELVSVQTELLEVVEQLIEDHRGQPETVDKLKRLASRLAGPTTEPLDNQSPPDTSQETQP